MREGTSEFWRGVLCESHIALDLRERRRQDLVDCRKAGCGGSGGEARRSGAGYHRCFVPSKLAPREHGRRRRGDLCSPAVIFSSHILLKLATCERCVGIIMDLCTPARALKAKARERVAWLTMWASEKRRFYKMILDYEDRQAMELTAWDWHSLSPGSL